MLYEALPGRSASAKGAGRDPTDAGLAAEAATDVQLFLFRHGAGRDDRRLVCDRRALIALRHNPLYWSCAQRLPTRLTKPSLQGGQYANRRNIIKRAPPDRYRKEPFCRLHWQPSVAYRVCRNAVLHNYRRCSAVAPASVSYVAAFSVLLLRNVSNTSLLRSLAGTMTRMRPCST